MIRIGGLRRSELGSSSFSPRLVEVGSSPGLEPGTVLITVDRVGKTFSPRRDVEVAAVSGVDMRLKLGRAYLLRGPSGSGKSTLLSLIGCMVRPTEGRIRVAGREVTRLPEDDLAELRRRVFGFVFQKHHLIRHFSALKNVLIPGLPRDDLDGFRDRALALLDDFGLGDRARTAVERLSGGEQQRVAIARALVNEPLAIIADEPTAHLDPGAGAGFLDLMLDLRGLGKLVVVASHDQALCESGCFDRVFEMSNGRVSEEGG
jgi:putative ABC transport system ATP-binding protein